MPKVSRVVYEEMHTSPKAKLDEYGREIPDPVPMAPPVGYVKQPSIMDRVRDLVRSEHLRMAAESAGAETFEEADDFEIGDDFDPSSPYEEVFDPIDSDARMRLRQEGYRASVEARYQELMPKPQGVDNGIKPDKGRDTDRDRGVGHTNKKRKGDSESEQDADDDRGVSKADKRSRTVEE